jgi:hypothetical protein
MAVQNWSRLSKICLLLLYLRLTWVKFGLLMSAHVSQSFAVEFTRAWRCFSANFMMKVWSISLNNWRKSSKLSLRSLKRQEIDWGDIMSSERRIVMHNQNTGKCEVEKLLWRMVVQSDLMILARVRDGKSVFRKQNCEASKIPWGKQSTNHQYFSGSISIFSVCLHEISVCLIQDLIDRASVPDFLESSSCSRFQPIYICDDLPFCQLFDP